MTVVGIVGSLLLVAANGFFVATEFAIARIRLTQVHELEAAGRPGARPLRHAVENLDAYLAACQLGITISSIALGIVGKPAFEAIFEPVFGPLGDWSYALSFAFAFGVVTLLHVVLGELAPKSLAIARNTRTALAIALPMRLFYIATRPFVDFFNFLGNLVLKPFGVPPAREVGHAPHSEDELRLLLRQSLQEGLIDADEREFAENVFGFGDRRARQIMVPRPEVDFVTTDQSLREAAAVATRSGHTRLPLCEPEGGLDRVVGSVNAKDILRAVMDGGEPDLADLSRPLKRVSESVLVDELLRDLRRDRQHLALVVDEHGTAIGLVSLEDILEEIVGDIADEFDRDEAQLMRWSDGALVTSGAAPIHLVADELGTEISNPDEATIGGHVLELLGRLPDPGEVVELDGHRARVSAVEDARIAELVIEPVEGAGR
ncbi:MAG TPA: hemolysin family protein [Gaiellaceae bacterium]|nr:hemolysin family protein [Gaiellaceae bacterium]